MLFRSDLGPGVVDHEGVTVSAQFPVVEEAHHFCAANLDLGGRLYHLNHLVILDLLTIALPLMTFGGVGHNGGLAAHSLSLDRVLYKVELVTNVVNM